MAYPSRCKEYKLFERNALDDALGEFWDGKKLNVVQPTPDLRTVDRDRDDRRSGTRQTRPAKMCLHCVVGFCDECENHTKDECIKLHFAKDLFCTICDVEVDKYHYRIYHSVLPLHRTDLQRENENQQVARRCGTTSLQCVKITHNPFNPLNANYAGATWPYANQPIYTEQTFRTPRRDIRRIHRPVLIFGQKGDRDGDFNRPWGICCDNDDNIIVADRSNNRIQVFNPLGQFVRKFGSSGSKKGQFNLPVAVAVDNYFERIIVSDKDNHRIQIFLSNGVFLNKFGVFGKENGEFNYPWDVAVNSRHDILVSDSRNSRIQLFTSEGEFLCRIPLGALQTPRGVCFTRYDEIVATDFDGHRMIILDEGDTKMTVGRGTAGADDGQLNRPSGVAVDGEGNYIVVDSKNHRIQVFDAEGNFVHKFGEEGSEPGQFNRPSDVCVLKSGLYVVMDYENSRIQVF